MLPSATRKPEIKPVGERQEQKQGDVFADILPQLAQQAAAEVDFSSVRAPLPVKLHCAELLAVYFIRAYHTVAQADNAVGHALYGVVMRDKDNGVAVFLFTRSMRSSISWRSCSQARPSARRSRMSGFLIIALPMAVRLLAAGKLRGHLVPVLPQAKR